jgi:hypothetical protein
VRGAAGAAAGGRGVGTLGMWFVCFFVHTHLRHALHKADELKSLEEVLRAREDELESKETHLANYLGGFGSVS